MAESKTTSSKPAPPAIEKNKKNDPLKKIKQYLEYLKSPATLGIIITSLFVFSANEYYKVKEDVSAEEQPTLIYRLFNFLDQKNADIRFLVRGPQVPQDKFAVLAIDDRSLEEIGRWPWDRDKTAHLIDKVMSYGAKAIGFDIVFSEPQVNQTAQTLSEIERQFPNLPAPLAEVFSLEKKKGQPDDVFAGVINKWKDKLVLGAFADEDVFRYKPYQDFCFNEAFKRSSANMAIENETLPPFVIDAMDNFSQIEFGPVFKPIFDAIEEANSLHIIKNDYKKGSKDELTAQEISRMNFEIASAYRSYCSRWLTKEDENLEFFKQNWSAIFASVKEMKDLAPEKAIDYFINNNKVHPIIAKSTMTINVNSLAAQTAHTSLFNALLDSDGTLRKSPLVYRFGNQYIPSLSLQTFLVANNLQAHFSLEYDKKTDHRYVKEVKIVNPETDESYLVPTDNRGRITINYSGPQQMFPHVPAGEFFTERDEMDIWERIYSPEHKAWGIQRRQVKKSEFVKDRTFIIGATAVGVYDLRVTPFEENYPGVETHVNVLHSLSAKKFIKTHPAEPKLMMVGIAFVGVILSFTLAHLSAIASLAIGAVFAIAIFGIDQYLFSKFGYSTTMSFLMFLVLTLYIGLTFYKYVTEERKKKYLKSTFSKYVSPAIVDEILKDPENIELGGKKQRMSVFFSDVRGFTTISEKLDPQVLSDVLNDYLTPMTQIVFANKGTLDKYMGDAVMAFFGAPIQFNDHAKYACRCALQSVVKLKELQESFKARNLPTIDLGIGINTGDMSVGNMGSDIVRNYTVMGDAVNLGSRLEGINKEYGTRIIISEYTHEDVKNDFVTREVDWVRVKGKYQPVRIFELLSEGKPDEETRKFLEQYTKGFQLYHEKKFKDAIECFNLALQARPDDPVSKLYVERCDDYTVEPPPEDWDGVHIMKTK